MLFVYPQTVVVVPVATAAGALSWGSQPIDDEHLTRVCNAETQVRPTIVKPTDVLFGDGLLVLVCSRKVVDLASGDAKGDDKAKRAGES